jgi:hypothetical protein
MKQFIVLLSLFFFTPTTFFSQNDVDGKKRYKYNNNFELALSASNQFMGALSWTHFHSITKKKRFKIGYGIRFNMQSGKNLYYTTAPAKLTSKRTDPGVLFSEIFYENVDTFYVTKSQNNSINISINLQYTLNNKLDIGFNIDALGFAFGGKTTGKYISSQSAENNSIQSAAPTSYNLLLVSDNDIGMLNSELYARYWLKQNWAIKVGASFVFTEYNTYNKLRLENDRWRNKALMGMIGITYSPFR